MNLARKMMRNAPLLLAALLCVFLPHASAAAEQNLQVIFKTSPDPPRSGDNTVEVTVLDAAGAAIIDAAVAVRFHMAAMPTMNMPEMSATIATRPAGNGHYRGAGRLVMAGTWEVTVTVTRDGARVARRKFTVNVKA